MKVGKEAKKEAKDINPKKPMVPKFEHAPPKKDIAYK